MASNTMVKIEGGGVDDYKVAQTSSCFPTVGSNMAGNDMLGDNFAAYDSPKSHIHYDDAFERWISGHFVALDNPPEHDARDHEAPHHQAPGDWAPCKYCLKGHNVGQGIPELYMGVGDVHDQGNPDTYMQVDGAGDERAPGNSPLDPITIHGKLTLLLPPP